MPRRDVGFSPESKKQTDFFREQAHDLIEGLAERGFKFALLADRDILFLTEVQAGSEQVKKTNLPMLATSAPETENHLKMLLESSSIPLKIRKEAKASAGTAAEPSGQIDLNFEGILDQETEIFPGFQPEPIEAIKLRLDEFAKLDLVEERQAFVEKTEDDML